MIRFQPPVYSKTKTLKEYRDRLRKAPVQRPNTKEAFGGLVFELCIQPGGPVGTLAEIHDTWGMDEVVIDAEDGELVVERDATGAWKPLRRRRSLPTGKGKR